MSPFARWVLYVGFALTGVLTTLLGPILPTLSARWRLDDAQAGLFFTAQFLGSLSGALLTGRLAPRFGVRNVIGAGFVLAWVGVIGASFGGWISGVVSVAIWGLGLGLVIPSVNLLVAEKNSGRRAAALNVLNFAWGLGAVAAPPVIAAALPGAGLRPLLLVLAALLATAGMLVYAIRVNAPPTKCAPPAGTAWSSSWVWLTGAFLFLYVGVENSVAGWMPSYALRVLGLPRETMAAAQAGFWSAILGVRLFAPALLRGMQPARLIVAGLTLSALGMVVLLAFMETWALFAGALLAGAGLATVFPTAVAVFTERAGSQASRLTGLVFAMAALGGATIPWSVGAVSTQLASLRLALITPLVCVLLMTLLQIRTLRSGHPRLPPDALGGPIHTVTRP